MIVFFVSISYTHAWEEYQETDKKESVKMEDREVIAHDFDLEIDVDGRVAEAEWDEFDIDGFEWFKLVHSTTNSHPVYPHDKTVFIGSADQTEASFKLNQGVNYVRICAVVLNDDYSKDRYCGAVQKIEVSTGDYEDEDDYKKEYSDKKTYEKKEEVQDKVAEKKTEVKDKLEAKKMYLSKSIKERIDILLENFIDTLEQKAYSDEKIVSVIDVVLERLAAYKDNEKYVAIINYMELVLREYRTEYDSVLGDLDEVFQDL